MDTRPLECVSQAERPEGQALLVLSMTLAAGVCVGVSSCLLSSSPWLLEDHPTQPHLLSESACPQKGNTMAPEPLSPGWLGRCPVQQRLWVGLPVRVDQGVHRRQLVSVSLSHQCASLSKNQ